MKTLIIYGKDFLDADNPVDYTQFVYDLGLNRLERFNFKGDMGHELEIFKVPLEQCKTMTVAVCDENRIVHKISFLHL